MRKFKIIFIYFICSFVINSCSFVNLHFINPKKFIGAEKSLLPDLDFFYSCDTYLEGNRYFVTGIAFTDRKAVIFISNIDGYIIDYFYSNLLVYDKVKEIPLGTTNEAIIKKFGKPASIFDHPFTDNEEAVSPYSFFYYYLQYNEEKKGISSRIIVFSFDANGNLIDINCFRFSV